MKYLKYFESVYRFDTFLNKFEQESANYLAYLYDEGVTLNVEDNTSYVKLLNIDVDAEMIIFISIKIQNEKKALENGNMTWEDIKDYIIPYFEFINSEYSFIDGNDFGLVGMAYLGGEGYNGGDISFNRLKPIDIMTDNIHFKHGSVEENPITSISFNIKL